MSLLRRYVPWIIGGWLACQITGTIGLAFGMSWDGPRSAAHHEEHCTCPITSGQACPMHHTRDDDRSCKVRSAYTGSDVALSALAGGCGVLPPSSVAIDAFRSGTLVRLAARSVIGRALRPESPPPRA